MNVVVAAATAWGRGALAVVRYSGSGLDEVLERVVEPFSGWPVPAGRARRVRLRDPDGTVFDDGVLVRGRAPHTYTGEDTAEISCHGNPLIVRRLLDASVAAGARIADPGEFSRRAVEHGRLDLVEAEAVLQLAEATTLEGLRIARDGIDGRLRAFYAEVRANLVEVAADLEARLDYPADELAYLDDSIVTERLAFVQARSRQLARSEALGRVLVHGARVALVGTVNAGKSSLFNALLGRTRALVHDQPGTTRDVLEVPCPMGPLTVTLLDTAGERVTTDPVEAAGLALARELVDEADLLVVVLRARPDGPDEAERAILARTSERPRVVVYNGVDRPGVAAPPPGAIAAIAPAAIGVGVIREAIVDALGGAEISSGRLIIASARQRDRLSAIADAAAEALDAMPVAGVAVAVDAVVRALVAIDELTGADTREDVLDALFARFCIGK